MNGSQRARMSVLEQAYTELKQVERDSDFIQVEEVERIDIPGWPEVERLSGWPSELYRITFTCTGLSGITSEQVPIRSDFHQFGMYLTRDFPASVPKMGWMTPIWHPNIKGHPCTNAPETHAALRPLSDLVIFIGELVQYRRYFAKKETPWPLDLTAAAWVRDYGEPRGWIGPDRPIDHRPLMRKALIHKATESPPPAPSPTPAGLIKFTSGMTSKPAPRAPVIRFADRNSPGARH